MKIAFCLFKFFPYGGLERDFWQIACECQKRGHLIDVYVRSWEGEEIPDGWQVHILGSRAWTNIGKDLTFIRQLQQRLADKAYDVTVAFNKIPGVDVYYAADPCLREKVQSKPWVQKWSRRYRLRLEWERQILQGNTQVFVLTKQAQATFQKFYQTPSEQFTILPPALEKPTSSYNVQQARQKIRHELALSAGSFLLLMVGSGFRIKGLDRILYAVASLPLALKQQVHLAVVGQGKPQPFVRLANQLGIAKNVSFLGGRKDVGCFYQAADLLLHPAYQESAGKVILEALVSGLPVITTDTCGYASYITQAQAGRVLASPFAQARLNRALYEALEQPSARKQWAENGREFAKRPELYQLVEQAVNSIEKISQ